MTYYRCVGQVPPKRHQVARDADGRMLTEELVGEEGFFHASSLLYHRNPPNALVRVEAVDVPALTSPGLPNSPLQPRMLQTTSLPTGGDPVTGRQTVLQNDDVRVSFVVADRTSPLFRDAVGDELVFVEDGTATLETAYGVVEAGRGDYVKVPMGCTHRWVVGSQPVRMLVLAATGHVGLPERYLSPRGQLLEHAPYCERDLRGPGAMPVVDDDGEVDVLVRHRDGVTRHTMAHHPFDVVGWDGCVYPYAFSIYDFEPIVKRFHAPPPVHETFSGKGFVVCSFCPRPTDFDPLAVPAPYAHSAVDCDELMFFVAGDYGARAGSGVGVGSITFHPAGWVHGPHPGAAERSVGQRQHGEHAVMVDTFAPLSLGAAWAGGADERYATTWLAAAPR